MIQGLPCGPVVKHLHFHCRGVGSIPAQGTKILHASWHREKKEKREKGLPSDPAVPLLDMYPKELKLES